MMSNWLKHKSTYERILLSDIWRFYDKLMIDLISISQNFKDLSGLVGSLLFHMILQITIKKGIVITGLTTQSWLFCTFIFYFFIYFFFYIEMDIYCSLVLKPPFPLVKWGMFCPGEMSLGQIPSYTYPQPNTFFPSSMDSFLTYPDVVKFPLLFGDHRLGQKAGDSEVPARGRKRQYRIMPKNLTKSLDKN